MTKHPLIAGLFMSTLNSMGRAKGSTSKFTAIAAIMAYSAQFIFVYRWWAAPLYQEYGLRDHETSITSLTLSILTILSGTLLTPSHINSFSRFFVWVIFLIIYIPGSLCLSMQGYQSFNATTAIAVLFLGYISMLLTSELKIGRSMRTTHEQNNEAFFLIFITSYVALTFLVVVSYEEILSFAGLDDIAEQRLQSGEHMVTALAAYAVNWLGFAFNPYLICFGLLVPQRRWYVIVGICGQLLVYATFAGKITLVSTILSIGLLQFIKIRGRISVNSIIFGFLTVMSIVTVSVYASNFELEGISLQLVSLLYLRLLAIQGAMLGVYLDFFSIYPLTHMSHANGFNLLTNYPYQAPIAYIIGVYLVGGTGFGANASFWATDGIAAFGLMGVIPISAVVGLSMAAANRIVTANKLFFSAAVALPFIMSLSNVPFFTSLVSGGGFLLALMVAFGAPNKNPESSAGSVMRRNQKRR